VFMRSFLSNVQPWGGKCKRGASTTKAPSTKPTTSRETSSTETTIRDSRVSGRVVIGNWRFPAYPLILLTGFHCSEKL
jgi:hypothetical protein